MAIKLRYETEEEVPAGFTELYEEKEGAWLLTGVEGLKSEDDVKRLKGALDKEKSDHKLTKGKLHAWGDLKPEEVLPKLDQFDEMALAADGKMDDTKIDALVESRLKSKLAPIERERDTWKTKTAELEATVGSFQSRERDRKIEEAVRKAAKGKLNENAIEDAMLYGARVLEVNEEGKVVTRDGVGVTPGLEPVDWLTDILPNKPHWGLQSAGGGAAGAKGGGSFNGDNPWAADNWNMTRQGEFLEKYGEEKAVLAAKQAGTTLGGAKPEKK